MQFKNFITAIALILIGQFAFAEEPDIFGSEEIKENRVIKLASEKSDGLRVYGVARSKSESIAKNLCMKSAQSEMSSLIETAVHEAAESYLNALEVGYEESSKKITEQLDNFCSSQVFSMKRVGTPLRLKGKNEAGKPIMIYYQCYEMVKTIDNLIDDMSDKAVNIAKDNSLNADEIIKFRDNFKQHLSSQWKLDSDDNLDASDIE